MPPKKSNKNTPVKTVAPPPSDQDHKEPPLRKNVDDDDISFEVEEHDDTANLKHEEIKGDEERDQLTKDEIGDATLAATCFSDLGVSQDTQDTMTPEQYEAFKQFCNLESEEHDKFRLFLHLQQLGFGLKNDEPKIQNKTVKESNSSDEEISFGKTQDPDTDDEGPKHGLSTMDPGQLEDFKETGREYKHVPTVLSQEERLRRNDSFMAYGINIGIAKNALAIMTDDQREETMELIVERIKTLLVESTGQGQDPPANNDDEKRHDITVPEASKYLVKFQRDHAKLPPILEEISGGEIRLLTKEDGAPISLRSDVWRALGRRDQS